MITFRIKAADNGELCDIDINVITKEQEYRR